MIITNNNYTYEILPDGTKIRTIPDGVIPDPEYPESMDVKITNKCDLGCKWCHEDSVKDGVHADYTLLSRIFNELPAGTEVAIGGGNPLTYPARHQLFSSFPHLYKNMTINANHIHSLDVTPNALGISYKAGSLGYMRGVKHPHIVIHLIAGVHTTMDLAFSLDHFDRVLILGYKDYGRGKTFRSEDTNTILEEWRDYIPAYLERLDKVIAFDNLAIEQLCIKRFYSKENWDKMYMGGDGQFTMYLDLVKQEFAVSSRSSAKFPIGDLTIKEMFRRIRDESENGNKLSISE